MKGQSLSHGPILLTDLLTTAVDDPEYSWTTHPPATFVSRLIRQLRTDLDDPNLATDQKVGGSSPSERAQVTGPFPHRRQAGSESARSGA